MVGMTWPTAWPADGALTPLEAPCAGTPFESIARPLGHGDVAMVAKVKGRFKPATEERDRWEQAAAAREEANGRGLLPIVLPRSHRPLRT